MTLLSLSARVCNHFSTASTKNLRMVQKVKDHELRDVVTSLDQYLHNEVADFVNTRMPGCELMSEEGEASDGFIASLVEGEWLVVDPLDGSNNYALSLPGYGFMAAHLIEGRIAGSVVVLPEHDIYFVDEGGELLVSQPFSPLPVAASGSTYYAYPPKLCEAALLSRSQLIDLVDTHSSGLYRYGSACVGLYNLIRGRHTAFIGHRIRLWDALAYFPLLNYFGIAAHYHIGSSGLCLVASLSQSLIDEVCDVITTNENFSFNVFSRDSKLVISS
jgi:myo-inositol-1(or 4)-monophosphatase